MISGGVKINPFKFNTNDYINDFDNFNKISNLPNDSPNLINDNFDEGNKLNEVENQKLKTLVDNEIKVSEYEYSLPMHIFLETLNGFLMSNYKFERYYDRNHSANTINSSTAFMMNQNNNSILNMVQKELNINEPTSQSNNVVTMQNDMNIKKMNYEKELYRLLDPFTTKKYSLPSTVFAATQSIISSINDVRKYHSKSLIRLDYWIMEAPNDIKIVFAELVSIKIKLLRNGVGNLFMNDTLRKSESKRGQKMMLKLAEL